LKRAATMPNLRPLPFKSPWMIFAINPSAQIWVPL
jgi:hypothetical protein